MTGGQRLTQLLSNFIIQILEIKSPVALHAGQYSTTSE